MLQKFAKAFFNTGLKTAPALLGARSKLFLGFAKAQEPAFKVVLVRHGQSEWNKANIFTGWHDVALTEQGSVAIFTLQA